MDLNVEKYFAIMGDIVDSRKIEDRDELQKKFVNIINSINDKYSDDIASKFLITLGDSFQGLLKKSSKVLNIIDEIESSMFPSKLRFGIGIGEIKTSIDIEYSSLIDGPAYHNARFAIDNIKKVNNKKRDSSYILVKSEYTLLDNLMNSSLCLCNTIKSNWSEKQRAVIDLIIRDGKTQDEAAIILGIKQPSVNERLKSSNIDIYREAFESINSAFALYLGEK